MALRSLIARHGDDGDMDMPTGTPWLMYPLQLGAFREWECSQNTTAECDYYSQYWHFWYESDHRFALPTVAFFTTAIILSALAYHFQQFAPKTVIRSKGVQRSLALARYFTYRSFRVRFLDWNTTGLGLLLLGLIGLIYFLCMTLVPQPYYWPEATTLNYWGGSPPLATRSGWLSLGCLPFVFLTAGKSNFITAVTGVSHEKLQVFHRWISYAFFVTALIHTFPFIVYNIKTGQMVEQWNTNVFYWTGVVALLAQGWLTFASMSPLRKLSYEWFKFSHFLAALVFMVFLFIHCGYTLSSWDYFIVTGVFFSLSWLHRHIRIYFEHGIGLCAHVHPEQNGFVRVAVKTNARWHVGQHFFVRFVGLGVHAFSTHPFTACSLPSWDGGESELVFYIRPQGGLTRRLAHHAETKPGSCLKVTIDGPYGGIDMQKLYDSQRQLVIAGGSGAGWVMPTLIAFLRRQQLTGKRDDSVSALPSIRVVFATRDEPTKQWFEEALERTLKEADLDSWPAGVEIETYFTANNHSHVGEPAQGQFLRAFDDPEKVATQTLVKQHSGESSSESGGSQRTSIPDVKYQDGRPDLPAIIAAEAAALGDGGHLGVFVCGPRSMQADVTNAVAKEQVSILKGAARNVYLHMEHFSWA